MGVMNDDGSLLFVIELFDIDLWNVLIMCVLYYEEIVCVVLDVVKVLNYLYFNKFFFIIYCDISSFNVLLWRWEDFWRVKLLDYGVVNFMC